MTLSRLRLVLWALVGVAALAATGLYAYTTMTRTADAAEGIASVLERRPGSFVGR